MGESASIEPQRHDDNPLLINSVPRRSIPTYDTLSYDDYLQKHLTPNTPFILSSQATRDWASARTFRIPSCSTPSLPNLSALRLYAHHVIPVANTLRQQFSEFERSEQLLGEVLDLWERDEGKGLYVKDWHLMAEIENEGRNVQEVYQVPDCLRDDWLNPPFDRRLRPRNGDDPLPNPTSTSSSDFRFTYLGPAGTYTPLHRDVYGSYSWSANIVGRKIWWLFPPDKLGSVKDKHGELVFDVRELKDEGGGIKILQEEGEIIFVPSGWHHQVLNIDFCISINHNFFASPTLPLIYETLCTSQLRVEEAISDVKEMIIERVGSEGDLWEKEWVEEVQGLLERDAGWGWKGFWQTVKNNVQNPPALEILSPSTQLRDGRIIDTIKKFKGRRDWLFLEDVGVIIQNIEKSIGPSG
ncbi:uncharacterized protein IL334_005717 [Kwoniella shivajii]|uniref:JmjC domain-containing protein n=1 Tax=Kwoniella shivajii TaxID=564305 RepID=A0ABZ1D3X2_9TREE|nr:hypothetical protein IL334_005717 [Kwoniella shivajii]